MACTHRVHGLPAATRKCFFFMLHLLHLLHPSLARVATLEPYRFRHHVLFASATLVALSLLATTTISATLAAASTSNQVVSTQQVFIAAPVADRTPFVREPFTVDVRPPVMYPVGANAPVGSGFGPRAKGCAACSTQHNGVDWNPGSGTPVGSIADGIVSSIGDPGNGYGVHLTIDHVVNGQAVTSLYAHLQVGSVPVGIGDHVRVGDTVGLVGATGIVTAPHLHFELQVNGATVNPTVWLSARGAQ
jgi:murein DD-endopeptidase MepM/ murein hydrolase activator NlpD